MTTPVTKVLLIEDDAGDHSLITRSLRYCRSEYSLRWADRLADGITCLEAEQFDVVLTDLSLPDAAGLEAVRRIRACDATTSIVVLTNLDDAKIEMEALNCGAQDYLVKEEATPQTLERVLQHAIQRHHLWKRIEQLLGELRTNQNLLSEQKLQLEAKNKRLRKIYKTAHRFVDNVSHEFRTPLTVIKDYVSLVREGMVGDVNDEQKRMLDIAAVRSNDLNNMVDDMLDVSKLQAGMLGVWRREYRLSEVVNEITSALTQRAAVKNIVFEVDVSADLPPVYCDGDKVGRVIINLVTNAMKFCGEPGRVRLSATVDPVAEEMVIGVSDNGEGIPKDQLDLLFRRFKQLNRNVKNRTKGFGLGLNIAKELVDLNFGEMRVESEVGSGSTFAFSVPLAAPPSVVRRYARRMVARKCGAMRVSVLTTSIAESVSEHDADDFDAFLNYMLRQHDLLFRRDTRQWLIVLAAEGDIVGFLRRVKREHRRTNRNRPFGPLCEYQVRSAGTWSVGEQSNELFEHFDRAFAGMEAACAV